MCGSSEKLLEGLGAARPAQLFGLAFGGRKECFGRNEVVLQRIQSGRLQNRLVEDAKLHIGVFMQGVGGMGPWNIFF